jgi:glyoxylase-like metal-dependent hydrolase (beta-lactamase superfamily II)
MIQVESVADGEPVDRLRFARDFFGRSFYYTAAYWVDGLLIDTGCAHTSRRLFASLEGRPVSQVVNTHCHEDHIGGNSAMQVHFGCQILAHPAALPILANPKLQPLQAYRRIFWGWPEPSRGRPIGDWVETSRHRFRVIRTPGHSPDHICLFEPEQGWLFSGDAYIGGRDRALREGNDILGILSSLRRLGELPVRTIFSGSGSVRSRGTEPLDNKIAYLEELGSRINALDRQGYTPRQIRRRLFGPEVPLTYLTLGHFSGLRLVLSFLSGGAEKSSPGP